jgi:hypothetical protein
MMNIDLKKGGINSIYFFESFQVILTTGYDNTVSVTKIKY